MTQLQTDMFLSLGILAGLICLVNLTFIVLVYHRGSVKKLENALLLSLGCSDFCVGTLAIPFILICNSVTEPYHCAVCITSFLLHRFISVSSVLHLLAVVYERYIKIIYPYCFEQIEFTRIRSSRIVPALWSTSLLISAIPLTWLLADMPCHGERSDRFTEYYDIVCLAFFLLLVLFMIFAFVRIYFVVRVQLRVIRRNALQTNREYHMTTNSSVVTDECRSGSEAAKEIMNAFSTTLVAVPTLVVRPSDLNCFAETGSQSQSKCKNSQNLRYKSRHHWLKKEGRIITRFAAMVLIFILAWGPYFYLSITERMGHKVSMITAKVVAVTRFLNALVNPWIVTMNNRDFRLAWVVFPACLNRIGEIFRRQGPR